MDVLSTPFPDQVLPQLRWELSFRPYLDYVEAQIDDCESETYKAYLEAVAAVIRAHPVLLEPIDDFNLLNEHSELIDLIRLNHIQPELKGDEPMYAMGTPSPINFFSYSLCFSTLMLDEL